MAWKARTVPTLCLCLILGPDFFAGRLRLPYPAAPAVPAAPAAPAPGDDMNIIQVDRPAVSRYHQISKFFAEGEGPDYAVHDFPNAAYGIKLGGFMVRGGHKLAEDGKARYLD